MSINLIWLDELINIFDFVGYFKQITNIPQCVTKKLNPFKLTITYCSNLTALIALKLMVG
jgi:hypothetical protein